MPKEMPALKTQTLKLEVEHKRIITAHLLSALVPDQFLVAHHLPFCESSQALKEKKH